MGLYDSDLDGMGTDHASLKSGSSIVDEIFSEWLYSVLQKLKELKNGIINSISKKFIPLNR